MSYEGEYKSGQRNGKGKDYYDNGKLLFEGAYLKGKRWDGKGYTFLGNSIYELKKGKARIREYYDEKLIFEGEYVNGEKMEKEKIMMINYHSKENIKMGKETEKEKSIIYMTLLIS